jgi:hypothetical protein
LTRRVWQLIAVALVVIVAAVGLGYWFLVPRTPSNLVSYTSQQTSLLPSWSVVSVSPGQLVDQNGKVVGDLGQPYADIATLSYSYNGSLFFRFSLRGQIPSSIASASPHVADVWYQVLLDTDLNPSTGYRFYVGSSLLLTPDYILMFHVVFNNTSNTVEVSSPLWRYSGTGTDWSWEQVGTEPVVAGGVGQDFVILTCKYQDLSVSKGSTLQFIARSGIRYDGQVYNDYVPDLATLARSGTVKIIL